MSTKRIIALITLAIITPLVIVGLLKWQEGGVNGGQKYAEPFRIAGNFYYVGANDVTSFLITGPQGHVLIDGGYPGTAKMIMRSIAQLGFNIRDVKILLNSEQHYDHAGGLAEIQKASGAKLWLSEPSADPVASGGYDRNLPFPWRLLTGMFQYARPHVDHRFKDGDTIRLGTTAITAHLTPGHTRGCTSFSFPVRDGDRVLEAVSACSLIVLLPGRYPGYKTDFERTFRVLRSIPADIWVTAHGRVFGRYRKFAARARAKNPADPFIDPAGYRAYIDSGESEFRRGVTH